MSKKVFLGTCVAEATEGTVAIVLGDDYGDNECTLHPVAGNFELGRRYALVAVIVEEEVKHETTES